MTKSAGNNGAHALQIQASIHLQIERRDAFNRKIGRNIAKRFANIRRDCARIAGRAYFQTARIDQIPFQRFICHGNRRLANPIHARVLDDADDFRFQVLAEALAERVSIREIPPHRRLIYDHEPAAAIARS